MKYCQFDHYSIDAIRTIVLIASIKQVLEQFQQMLGDKRLRPRAELTPESSYDSDDCDKETAYQTDD